MLAVECLLATAVLTFIGYVIHAGGSVEDRSIGKLLFALAGLTGGLWLFCDKPEVALALQALIAIEAIGLATVLIRERPR